MIIQSKFRSRGLALAIGQFSARACALALLCSTVAACSGTIDTPTDEFPAREDDDTPAPAPRPAATAPAATAPAATAPAAQAPAATTPVAAAPTPTPVTPAPAAPAPAAPEPAAPAPAGDLSFENDVWPIFQDSCGPCHVSDGAGGQNIGSDDLAEALDDSVSFEPRVIATIETGRMPLGCGQPPGGGGNCVSEEDFATIEDWYEAGAPE
jgi:hypothetical protein